MFVKRLTKAQDILQLEQEIVNSNSGPRHHDKVEVSDDAAFQSLEPTYYWLTV